jgi:hypothetical protein
MDKPLWDKANVSIAGDIEYKACPEGVLIDAFDENGEPIKVWIEGIHLQGFADSVQQERGPNWEESDSEYYREDSESVVSAGDYLDRR